jgi:hypothetical protein
MGNKSKQNGVKQSRPWKQRRNLTGARLSTGWTGLMPRATRYAVKTPVAETPASEPEKS